MEENFIKKLVGLVKCTVCGHNYDPSDINIVGQEEELWLLRVSCAVCHSKCYVAVVISEDETDDLARASLNSSRNADAITSDDVLGMQEFLEDFNGDFAGIFLQG